MARKPVSDQLRDAVRKCGKTRYRISQETGIPQSTLSRFVNLGHGLTLDNVDLLCECIGVSLTGPNRKKVRRGEHL